jgi:hypothetical protein
MKSPSNNPKLAYLVSDRLFALGDYRNAASRRSLIAMSRILPNEGLPGELR